MSKRIKNTNIFNKNHILITKTEYNGKNGIGVLIRNTDNRTYIGKRESWVNSYYINETFKSPLGFYYIKQITKYKGGSTDISDYKKWKEINVYLPNNISYKITYITHCDNKTISAEVRPWEVSADDKPMAEHFIFALKEEIDKIINLIDEHRLVLQRYVSYMKNVNLSLTEFKREIYKDLFGSEKGIRFQTDAEKILSHGFDLKSSFRKPKEKC